MKLHEYQAVDLLKSEDYKIPCAESVTISSAEDASGYAVTKLGADNGMVLKAQVLVGDRGQGKFLDGTEGYVHIARGHVGDVKDVAGQMLGKNFVSEQTGKTGLPCNKVLVCQKVPLDFNAFLAFELDRSSASPLLTVVRVPVVEGGSLDVDLEDIMKKHPDTMIYKIPIDVMKGLKEETETYGQIDAMLREIGFTNTSEALRVIGSLYRFFKKNDCTSLEITSFGQDNMFKKVLCSGINMEVDDNALFRQKDIFALHDKTQEHPAEIEAKELDLNYIKLDGSIGCMVNGAGLAMATMDLIKQHNGSPANFLDVGGSASTEQVTNAFRIISSDENVKVIFVNIFGGIMRCDVIAEGIIAAMKVLPPQIPVVARLQGTKVEEAKKMIAASGLNISACDNMDEAAKMAVKLGEESGSGRTQRSLFNRMTNIFL